MATTRTYRSTGDSAIAETLSPGTAWQIESIRVHLSEAGGAGNITATIDHGSGAAFDIVLLSEDMTSIVDLIWSPYRPMEFSPDDEIIIAWENVNSRTYGLEIVFKGI